MPENIKMKCPICDSEVQLETKVEDFDGSGTPLIEVALSCSNETCNYEAFTFLKQSGLTDLELA